MIPSLRNLSYEEKLKRLGILSLRRRRLRGDMIEVSKIIHGIKKVNVGKLFRINENGITKLYRSFVRSHLEYCIQFLSQINEKDADMLGTVERRVTKLNPRLRKLSYEEIEKVWYVFSKV